MNIRKRLAALLDRRPPSTHATRRSTSRRTYARLLHDAGVPVVAIQQNLGHATLETTLPYVGDLTIEQRKPTTILRPNMRWLKGV